MAKPGKRYRSAGELVEAGRSYPPAEAVGLLGRMDHAKFDESVELVLGLGIDPRQSDQMVRGTVALPHGTGKEIKVLAFCSSDQAEDARAAGANYTGGKDLVEKIKGGWLDFDVAVAGKDMMREISQLGKILGPRGLMPSPKAGTVTDDIPKAVKELKAGKIEFKSDKFGNVQVALGKVSFSEENLVENIESVIKEVIRVRPTSVKGKYITRAFISSTMSPSIKLDLAGISGS